MIAAGLPTVMAGVSMTGCKYLKTNAKHARPTLIKGDRTAYGA